MTRFDECLSFILKWEGGKSDHPKDPGGRTNQGITQKAFAAYKTKLGQPVRDVFTMTEDEMRAIYFTDYWMPAHCGSMVPPLDLIQFDTAVQRGPHSANRMLQQALQIHDDGIIGPQTKAALTREDPKVVAMRYATLREEHYRKRVREDSSQKAFFIGWMNRLADLEKRLMA